jgi:hypothetical protein
MWSLTSFTSLPSFFRLYLAARQDADDHKDDQSTMMMMMHAGRRHASLAALVLVGLRLTMTIAFVFPSSSLCTPFQGTVSGWLPWVVIGRERGTHCCTRMTHPGLVLDS